MRWQDMPPSDNVEERESATRSGFGGIRLGGGAIIIVVVTSSA